MEKIKNKKVTKLFKKWSNFDNKSLYENMPLSTFQHFSISAGLDNGCDLDLLYNNYIKNANSILEVGAGYGRVIFEIRQRGYQKSICAIERNKKLVLHLKKLFKKNTIVTHTDIMKFNTKKKFDLILFLWSGLTEFPPGEQQLVISKLASMMQPNSHIVIDSIHPKNSYSNAKYSFRSEHIIECQYGKLYGYFPSDDELNYYAKQNRLEITETIQYTTSTGRNRFLKILTSQNQLF